ncbi:substrate-binding periplasmic protein [Aquipseudomonas campi]|uniref:substrate-binding periplasmic protein n=1 Tax=Aquipseudomonas campi TaxID=2731681 RepID=UPI001EFF48B7|nr:transporter substrate-binding domain-containing protein [Pseudomonas campi]
MTATRLCSWLCAFLLGSLCLAASAQPLHLYTEEYPPINFTQNGQPTGLATEVVREIMRRTGQNAPINVVPWARGYQEALVRANTGLFVTMRTSEREPLFKWVGPLTRNVISFYSLTSSYLSLSGLEQARHFDKIAVARGWHSHQRLLAEGFTNLAPVTGPAQMVSMLKRGRVKLIVLDNLSLNTLLTQGDIQADEVQRLFTLTHSDSYIAFSRDTDDALIQHWQRELDAMKADGSFTAIYHKWLPGEPVPSQAPQPTPTTDPL